MQQNIVEAPISEFESQVLSDYPELSPQEANIVASTLLRCGDYANQHAILPDMRAAPSSSSDDMLSLSGPSAEHLVSVTPRALVNTPATPDLSIVVHSCNDTMVEPLPRPDPSESCSSQQPLHQASAPGGSASGSSRRILKPMNSEIAFDFFINESVE